MKIKLEYILEIGEQDRAKCEELSLNAAMSAFDLAILINPLRLAIGAKEMAVHKVCFTEVENE